MIIFDIWELFIDFSGMYDLFDILNDVEVVVFDYSWEDLNYREFCSFFFFNVGFGFLVVVFDYNFIV